MQKQKKKRTFFAILGIFVIIMGKKKFVIFVLLSVVLLNNIAYSCVYELKYDFKNYMETFFLFFTLHHIYGRYITVCHYECNASKQRSDTMNYKYKFLIRNKSVETAITARKENGALSYLHRLIKIFPRSMVLKMRQVGLGVQKL